MAIYHFSVKVISRATGASAVASAAYRSASRLHDERLDRDHDFTNKSGVVHSEVMLPDGAPEQLSDRAALWNTVEAGEKRKDAQLSREVEFAIPREMDQAQGIELARDFVQREMVDRGMVADLNVHWDIGPDGLAKPHAHVMLSMREVGEDGFGAKVRDWNRTELVEHWREAWADHVNERLASLDIDARIDHRSLDAQGIDLEPQHKIGPAAGRRAGEGLEADRLDEHHEIARANGERIIADPRIARDAITKQQATFTRRDLAMCIHRHSDGKEQFDRAMSAVQASPELVVLSQDGRGQERFTSREMIAVEDRLHRASALMAEHRAHRVSELDQRRALARAEQRGLVLSGEQKAAFEHVTVTCDLGVVVGYARAAAKALPKATQVVDRWHLMENASRAFLDAVRKSMRQIRTVIGAATINPDLLTAAERIQYEGYLRREHTNAAILSHSKAGATIKEIVRRTGVSGVPRPRPDGGAYRGPGFMRRLAI